MSGKKQASCFQFSSLAEVYTYITCIMLGISILIPLNALLSAPSYMTNYYKYVTGNMNAKPNNEFFWANIMTFYNMVSTVTQIIVAPTVLLPFARRLSLNFRFSMSIALMMSEVIVTLLLPAIKVSQELAMVALFIVTVAAGMGKSYLEATSYVIAGTMPSKFMSAVMIGCSFSGVTTSVLQCIVKASFPDTYKNVLQSAYLYFSLTLFCMGSGLVMALSLRWNSFAQRYVGEYNMARVRRELRKARTHNSEAMTFGQSTEIVPCARIAEQKSTDVLTPSLNVNGKEQNDESGDDLNQDVGGTENFITTSQQLMSTAIGPVFKLVYSSMLTCFITFFLTLLIAPSLMFPIDRNDSWFGTIMVLLYYCGDASGRLLSSFRFLWIPRKVLFVAACCRFLFLIPYLLCIYKYIPGHLVPYILTPALGLTNGLFGSLAMVYGPITPGIHTDGQRAVAGQLMGISLLCGVSMGSVVAFGVLHAIGR